MSKWFILVFIVLTSATRINSQIIQNYGFKVGYVSSSQTYSGFELDDSIKRKNGISFSGFIYLFDFNGFTVSPEIKYIQKGAGLEFIVTGPESPDPIGKTTKYIYHNYLSIPISFVYKMKLGAGIPFIKIAPRYDILLSSDDDLNSPASTYESYKNVFGGTLSIGFVPNFNFVFNPFIELSYHMDFTDTYSGINNNIRNNAVEINLGVQF